MFGLVFVFFTRSEPRIALPIKGNKINRTNVNIEKNVKKRIITVESIELQISINQSRQEETEYFKALVISENKD